MLITMPHGLILVSSDCDDTLDLVQILEMKVDRNVFLNGLMLMGWIRDQSRFSNSRTSVLYTLYIRCYLTKMEVILVINLHVQTCLIFIFCLLCCIIS